MRILALADIHGNLAALEAVLADSRRHAADLTVNLGDHLSGPLQAAATADCLMSLDMVHIRGNHDRQLLDRPAAQMGPSDAAAHAQLSATHLRWLAALPPTATLDNGALLVHGTPSSDLEYLLEEVTPAGATRLAAPTLIRERMGSTNAALVLCGHSHNPRCVQLPGGGPLIVNPGSVGLPAYEDADHVMETGSPHARYAVLDRINSTWSVTFHTVEYDWSAAAALAQQAHRPDWARALATGYVRSLPS